VDKKKIVSFSEFLRLLSKGEKLKGKEFFIYNKDLPVDDEIFVSLLSDFSPKLASDKECDFVSKYLTLAPLSTRIHKKFKIFWLYLGYAGIPNTCQSIWSFIKSHGKYLWQVNKIISRLKKLCTLLTRYIEPLKKTDKQVYTLKIKDKPPFYKKRILHDKKTKGFVFSVAAYGEEYLNIFLNYSLKSQLSQGNIPSLKNLEQCEYNIYTTFEDKDKILGHPSIQKLKTYMPVYITTSSMKKGRAHHALMNAAYLQGLVKSLFTNRLNAFINADVFFSEGFLPKAQNILKKHASVEVVGPRSNFEKFSKHEKIEKALERDGSVDSKDLSLVAAQTLNDVMEAHFIKDENGPYHPSQLYWKIKDNAYLVFCFHICPMFFNPTGLEIKKSPSSTIDDDLVASFDVPFSKRYFLEDANDMFCCELSKNRAAREFFVSETPTFRKMIKFYKSHNYKNVENLKVAHKFGDMSLTEEEWSLAYKKIEPVMKKIRSNII